MLHELKCLPAYFAAVCDGSKPFEVRRADRPFADGDVLLLHEWCEEYTGRTQAVLVTYVLGHRDHEGIRRGFCVLGVRRIESESRPQLLTEAS